MEESEKAYAVVDEGESSYDVEQRGSHRDARYVYQPLPSKGNHLRLLKLKPGDEKRLSCSIETHIIESPDIPPFKALSYSWQNPRYDNLVIEGRRIQEKDDLRSKYDVVHPLWCGEKRVLISTSLRDALRVLRHETQPVWLWVDALCINQQDLDERASQVLLMQRIYHVADEVCMWLGVEDEFTVPAFDMFANIQALSARRTNIAPMDLYETNTRECLGMPVFPGREWEATVRLLGRPYFRRIWILQEMIASGLTARVYCGTSNNIAWTLLLEAVLFLENSGWAGPIDSFYGGSNHFSFIRTVHNLRMAWMQGATTDEGRLAMRRLAGATRRFEASDPRDKIFALVGIINDFGHRELFGADRPEGSSGAPVKVSNNAVHLTFHVDERGKSQEDIAVEILKMHFDTRIRKLYDAVIDFFRGNLRVADALLDTENDPNSWVEDYADKAQKAIKAGTSIREFNCECRKISLDHQRVGDFAEKAYSMFGKSFMDYVELISEYVDTPDFVTICRLPQLREEVERFREGNEWLLKSLVLQPDRRSPVVAASDGGAEKTPIVVGNRKHLDSLDYSVDIQRLYPDWAWSAAGWVVPMYDKPTEHVYTEYAAKCLQDDGNLSLLSSVEDASQRRVNGLPSWVPDFSADMVRGPLVRSERDASQIYSAAGFTKGSIRWNVLEKEVLGVHGYKVDKIRLLASAESAQNTISSQPQEWATLIQGLIKEYPTRGTTDEALWRTLIGDYARGSEGYKCPAPAEYADYYASFVKLLQINKKIEGRSPAEAATIFAAHNIEPMNLPALLAQKDKLVDAMSRVMIERRLFVTEGGFIGAGPVSAQVGDDVYILSGGSVPYVLRAIDEDRPARPFRFVGDCYLHGVMSGAVMRRQGFRWTDLELR